MMFIAVIRLGRSYHPVAIHPRTAMPGSAGDRAVNERAERPQRYRNIGSHWDTV
jgi:hypothetical protein